MDYIKIDSEKVLLEEIVRYERIILYGCGEVGQLIHRRLYQNEIAVESFAVTKGGGRVNGLPVYEIDQITCSDNLLIIVATKENHHGEILQVLESRHMTKVACILDILYEELISNDKKPRNKLYFQIHIVEHCNLNCRGCYHFSPLAKEEYLSLEEYTRDIRRLAELFDGKMERIMLLGGEPLLHPQIAEFIQVTRDYFSEGTIKILSNGILIPKMPETFWDICESTGAELWLTKYPINIDYMKIEKIAEKHKKTIRYFSQEPVRTLGHQPLDISGKRDYVKNFYGCYRANQCILLEHGKMYTCLIAAESRHFSKYFDTELEICEKDYVDIYEVCSAEELQARLTHPTPFCRYCNRDDVAIFGRIPWQVSKCRIEEWTE